jgi:hypothetical protein
VLLTIDITLQEEPSETSVFVPRTNLIDERISLAIQDITDKVRSSYVGILDVKDITPTPYNQD